MNKISKILKGSVIAVFAALIIAAPTFATIESCFQENQTNDAYPNLKRSASEPTSTDGKKWVKCTPITENGKKIQMWGRTSGDCMQLSSIASNPESCESKDLNSIITTIINAVIFVIGMVAVVMIILGGINYATSQGDPAKVKKGKDTILYGIIGLVVALLAYAIVNFVLTALNG